MKPASAQGGAAASTPRSPWSRCSPPLYEYAITRDPLGTSFRANLGIIYLAAERLDEAIASFRTALRLAQNYSGARQWIGVALLMKGGDQVRREGAGLGPVHTIAVLRRRGRSTGTWYQGDRGQQRISMPEFAILTLLLLRGGGAFWSYQRTHDAGSDSAATATSYVRARHCYALMLMSLGRPDEGLPQIQQATELDPLSAIIRGSQGHLERPGASGKRRRLTSRRSRSSRRDPSRPHQLHSLLGRSDRNRDCRTGYDAPQRPHEPWYRDARMEQRPQHFRNVRPRRMVSRHSTHAHAAFLGLRSDKSAQEVRRETAGTP